MASSPHVSDVGTVFTITVKDQDGVAVDLSTSSSKTLTIRSPKGTTTTWTLSYVTNGSDGKVTYTTVSGDLHTAGTWAGQLAFVFASASWKTDLFYFEVEDNL